MFKKIFIVADIEGSSGCWSYEASKFMNKDWGRACLEMSRDVNAMVEALFAAGVEQVTVKDFHRTAYNLLPPLIDKRARIIHGYIHGPVPGMGDPSGAEAAMFVGMHAASRAHGFLGHTLTSRIRLIEVNEKPITELELFSASLAPYGIRPVFFSGDYPACEQAEEAIPGIICHPLDKSGGPKNVDVESWREGLALAAVKSLDNSGIVPFAPKGPFKARMFMRDGEKAAQKIARLWNFETRDDYVLLETADINELYMQLIRAAFLTPLTDKIAPAALFLFNLYGKAGLAWIYVYYFFSRLKGDDYV